jgi:Type II secretion system (T2SS), protein M subtype b
MTLSARDKRALLLLVPALAILLWKITSSDGPAVTVAAATDSVPLAEKRLAKLRRMYAMVPGKEELYKKAAEELAAREKGMIVADTAQQAQAQIQQILRRVGALEHIEVRGAEFGQVKALGADYGEAPVSVTFDCAIEQFVNFLADLANQPEMLGTTDIRVATGNPKDKRIGVRLTVAGVIPKKLVPEKKGVTSF